MTQQTGVIFDIKGFSTNDGPGPRTTVFLKGCPLRCVWCHNPEGLSPEPQLMHKHSLCTGCARCLSGCSHSVCQGLERCIYACPKGLNEVSGTRITADALAEKLLKSAQFLRSSGGGITFSGGEPLMQHGFVCSVIERLQGLHTAIETSGYASESVFRKTAEKLDLVMMDIKLCDPAAHRRWTGVDNEPILRNLKWLKQSGKAHIFRVPLIPGITDGEDNLRGISALAGDSRVELLPYNEMAGAKYPTAGMEFTYQKQQAMPVDPGIFQNAVLMA